MGYKTIQANKSFARSVDEIKPNQHGVISICLGKKVTGASGSIIWMVFGLPGYRSGLMREEFANNANNKICFLSLAEVLVVSPNPRGRTPPPSTTLFQHG